VKESFEELIGVFAAANPGIKNLVAAIFFYPNTNKKGSSNFADLLMD
jgi:hypothetical protein